MRCKFDEGGGYRGVRESVCNVYRALALLATSLVYLPREKNYNHVRFVLYTHTHETNVYIASISFHVHPRVELELIYAGANASRPSTCPLSRREENEKGVLYAETNTFPTCRAEFITERKNSSVAET